MRDEDKTKEQLIQELVELRQRLAKLEALEVEHRPPPPPKRRSPLLTTEDYWAVWLGLGVIALAMGVFWAGSTIKSLAVTPSSWSTISAVGQDFVKHFEAYAFIFLGFGAIFALSMWAMGRSVREFMPG